MNTTYDQQGQSVRHQTNIAGDSIGRDKITITGDNNVVTIHNLVEGVRRLPTDYATRIENFLIEYLGTEKHRVPFGGRDAELAELDAWLTDDQAPPYMLLTAPAGRGKSALLVRWCQALEVREGGPAVVFVPVSIRFRTNLASVVFAALAARLAYLYGDKEPGMTESAEVWRGMVSSYLARLLPDGRKLLVILDGVDEAADWDVGADLFPKAPQPGLRVIVSARQTAERPGGVAWQRALGWEWPEPALMLDLNPLDREGVGEILARMGIPLDLISQDVDIVAELHRLSEGDPLLVRMYADALCAEGSGDARLEPIDLHRINPGLEGYFERWWKDQRELWDEETSLQKPAVQALLNLLACALGPLTRDDLLTLAAECGPNCGLTTWTLDAALERVARLVIGDGRSQGSAFCHPRLAQFFYEKLSQRERNAWEQRFVVWGQQTMAALQSGALDSADVPAYLVQYYGAHLARVEVGVGILRRLVSNDWKNAWHAYEGAYSGFLNDVDRVWSIVECQDTGAVLEGRLPLYLGLELRCALCHSSVHSLSSNLPTELPALLVKYAFWSPTQAIASIQLIPNSYQRNGAWAKLALQVPASVLDDIVLVAQNMPGSEDRARAMAELAVEFPAILLDKALVAARDVKDSGERASLLIKLIPYLHEAERDLLAKEVLAALRGTDNVVLRINLVEKLLSQYPGICWREVKPLVLELPDSLKWMGLEKLAPYMRAPYQEVLTLARNIWSRESRAKALLALVEFLPQKQQVSVLREVLTIAEQIPLHLASWLFQQLPHLPQALLPKALHVARQAGAWPADRATMLGVVASCMSNDEQASILEEALLTLQEIAADTERAYLLERFCSRFADRQALEKMLVIARSIGHEPARADLLHALARRLPGEDQLDVLYEALAALKGIDSDEWRAPPLLSLIPDLPQSLLPEALKLADEMMSPGWRDQVFAVTIPRLADTNLLMALDVARGNAHKSSSALALTELSLRMSEGRRKSLLLEALSAAQAIRDSDEQAMTLAELGLYLVGEDLEQALAAARGISAIGDQVTALARLASRFHGFRKEQLLTEALATAQHLEWDHARAEALVAIAPYLSEGKRKEIATEVFVLAQEMDEEIWRAAFLTELAPVLPENLLADALAVAGRLQSTARRASVIAALLRRLPEKDRALSLGLLEQTVKETNDVEQKLNMAFLYRSYRSEEMVEGVLYDIRRVSSLDSRTDLLARISPLLSEVSRDAALREALDTARDLDNQYAKARALTLLLRFLPEDTRWKVAEEALSIAWQLNGKHWSEYGEGKRARVIRALVPSLVDWVSADPEAALRVWQVAFRCLSSGIRRDLLSDIAAIAPFIHALGGEDAIVETFHAIQDVGKWWP